MSTKFDQPPPHPLGPALGSLVSAGVWLLALLAVLLTGKAALADWRGGPFYFAPWVTTVLAVVALRRYSRLMRQEIWPRDERRTSFARFAAWMGLLVGIVSFIVTADLTQGEL